MTFRVFGNSEIIALPTLDSKYNPFALTVHYPRRSFEPFYSHYGFAYPITRDTVPIEVIIDNQMPIDPPFMDMYHPIRRYLLVDHEGRLWKALIQPNENNDPILSMGLIHKSLGWWMTSGAEVGTPDADRDLLLGYLYTNPSLDKLKAHWRKYEQGGDLVFLTIADIVAKLNKEFPRTSKAEKLDKPQRDLKRTVDRMIDHAIKEKKPSSRGLT